ncbi:MAG: hypothetical protein KDA80_11830 [Planctomycetaceae bacterium]|nr:hypothetical protein [Planctomycetaceae bacterium]
MFRSVLRNLTRIVAAIVLLALMVCAVEVGLRARNVQQVLTQSTRTPDATRIIIPSRFSWIDVAPLIGIEPTRPVQGDEVHSPSTGRTIRTSEFGTRGASPLVPKPADVFRVMLLGGEAVFGLSLPEERTLTSQLATRLSMTEQSGVELINAGCPNAGPLVNFLRYRHHLSVLEADLVVYCLTPGDLAGDVSVRGALRLDGSKLPAYAPHPRFTSSGNECVDGICQQFETVNWLLGKAEATMGLDTHLQATGPFQPEPDALKRLLAPLLLLQKFVQDQGGKLVVSIVPTAWDLQTPSAGNPSLAPPMSLDQQLRSLDSTGSLAVQNTIDRFRSVPDKSPLFSTETANLSETGVEAYSYLLAEFLRTDPSLANRLQIPASLPGPASYQPTQLPDGSGATRIR